MRENQNYLSFSERKHLRTQSNGSEIGFAELKVRVQKKVLTDVYFLVTLDIETGASGFAAEFHTMDGVPPVRGL